MLLPSSSYSTLRDATTLLENTPRKGVKCAKQIRSGLEGLSGRPRSRTRVFENGRSPRSIAIWRVWSPGSSRVQSGERNRSFRPLTRPRAHVRSRGRASEGCAELTDVSQSAGNRLPRPRPVFYIFLETTLTPAAIGRHSRVSPHFACTAFHVFFAPARRGLTTFREGERRAELYTANQFTVPAFGTASPRSEGGL